MRGLTLVELLVAMAIMALLSVLIYSSIDGMRRSRQGVQRITDRYREGRIAMTRMAREIQGAYLSEHLPISPSLQVVRTAFIGDPGTPADRIDFNSFAYQRLDRDSKEGDQMEVSYFGSRDPARRDVMDLVRRVSPRLDDRPEQGGRVEVLATDIDLFDLKYLDPLTGMWRDEWDSTSAVREAGRLPLQVQITLVLKEGMRAGAGRSRNTIRLSTKVPLQVRDPLNFAIK
jgi:general secretion pathway protein J